MKTQEFLDFIDSAKTEKTAVIAEAMQQAVLVIMLDDNDDMPIKNRFTSNNNKADGNKKATKSELSGDTIDNLDTETVLIGQMAGLDVGEAL